MANIRIDNLRKEYGSLVAVDDISLELPEGELLVMVGPSGSGKSTALRMIAGLTQSTSGAIEFDGDDVTGFPPEQREIGMVFQDLALYPHMSSADNIAFPLEADGDLSESRIESKVQSAAELADCDHLLEKQVTDLSGGQRQRVALARALVQEPEVFLLDEPLSDLDELLKRKLRSEIANLQKQLGITAVHVTHDQEEAMTVGDRIAVMWEGKIAQLGTPREVFERPATPFVARFIGSPQMNLFEVTVESLDDQVAILGNEEVTFRLSGDQRDLVDSASTDRLTAAIRPQHINWSTDEPDSDVASVAVEAAVVEMVSTEDVVHFHTQAGTEIRGSFESELIAEGETGYLTFPSEALHLYDSTEPDAERVN